jgi:outer membrane receptor protein involved in Fe transport
MAYPFRAQKQINWMIAAAAGAGVAASDVAFAQEPPAGVLDEISVTGTRIRRDDFSNPQPTTVVTNELINSLGIVNIGDMMSQMPANVGSYTPTAKPGGNGGDNTSFPLNVFNGLNLANLRGLNPSYGTRTLTLVDSRRHVPTNQGDGVDLNMIPTIIVDRMEVVTGGASASYGSGAIAGVVNVLLDRDLTGIKAQADYGQTSDGEGSDRHYSFAWGGDIGELGHLVAAYEGQRMDPIDYCLNSREWCQSATQIRANTGYASPANTLPNYVHVDNVRVDNSKAGVFPLLNVQLDQTGTQLSPFQRSNTFGQGGDGRHANAYLPLRSNVDRDVLYAAYERNLTDRMVLNIEASAGHVESYSPQIPFDLGSQLIRLDNYYLQRMAVNPCAGLTETFNSAGVPQSNCRFSKDFKDQSNTANDTQSDLQRIVFGFNGEFGESTWNWDGYYQYGKSETLQAVYDSRYLERFNFGLDVVDDGLGNPICRVTRDGIAAYPWFKNDPRLGDGCAPINAFGTTNLTPEGKAFGFGRILENTYVTQEMVEFVASGELFKGFGDSGPIRAAIGTSWREESIDNPADATQPDYLRRDYQSQFGESFGGDTEVWEVFGELDIPVGQRATFQTAVRSSDYENTAGIGTGIEGEQFGYDITTWKVNANWRTTDWLTLRASHSLDIRAPAMRDLFSAKIFAGGSAISFCSNPWTGNISQGAFTFTGDPCALYIYGDVRLRPEEAHTSTLGFILTPERGGVRFAADYYNIEIEDAISAGGGAINDCYQFRIPEQCALITGPLLNPADPLGGFSVIESTTSYATNNRSYEFSGIDLTGDWLKDFRFGNISMRLVLSHMIDQLIQPSTSSAALRDIAGVTGVMGGDWRPAPDWSGQWITSYVKGPFVLTAQMRYVSESQIYPVDERRGPQDEGYNPDAANSIDNNRVPSYNVWGLNGSYDIQMANNTLQVFGSINNVFDKEPPVIGNGAGGTNPIFYDTVGRTYRVGVRVAF